MTWFKKQPPSLNPTDLLWPSLLLSATLPGSVTYNTLSLPLDCWLLEGRASVSCLHVSYLFAWGHCWSHMLARPNWTKTPMLFYHSWWCRSVPSQLSLVSMLSVNSRALWTRTGWWWDTEPQHKGRAGLSSQVGAIFISAPSQGSIHSESSSHPPTSIHTHTHTQRSREAERSGDLDPWTQVIST